MRFATRYDRWLVVVLIVAPILPVTSFLAPASHPPPLWIAFVPVSILLIVLAATLPQYYEVREDGLFLRQGWRKILIPYPSLTAIQPASDARSAPVFSLTRLMVTGNDKRFVIAVAEQERFLAEVSKRCPQLERTGLGLGTPLFPSLD